MRILITNDDGVFAPGLHALARAARAAGHDVIVAAPSSDHSGCGGSIGPLHLSGRLSYQRLELEELRGTATFAVDGPPALAVIAGCLGGFGPMPEAVLSGVNPGANAGAAILHSGTVGAALTAVNAGVPSVATSLAVAERADWTVPSAIAVSMVPWIVAQPHPLVLNVNVPDLPLGEIAGVRATTLSAGGVVQAAVVERFDDSVQLTFADVHDASAGTDVAALRSGFVSVTPLAGIRATSILMRGRFTPLELDIPEEFIDDAAARLLIRGVNVA